MRATVLILLLGLFLFLMPVPAAAQDAAPESAGEAAAAPEEEDPLRVELDSPRATMATFLRAMAQVNRGVREEEAWQTVAQTLDAPQGMDPFAQQEAARAILEVLDKLGEVTLEQMPATEQVRNEDIGRFVYFPRTAEQRWVWDELEPFNAYPAGEIVLDATAPGRWQFSTRTVVEAPALAASLAPLPPKHLATLEAEVGDDEGLVGWFGGTFRYTHWWEWLTLLGGIFVGLTLGKIVSAILRKIGDQWKHHGWPVRAALFHAMASPASLALLTIGLQIGLAFIWMNVDLEEFVARVIQFLYLLVIGWMLYNLVDAVEIALNRATGKTHNRLDDMVVPLIRKSLRVFIVVVVTLFVAQNIFGLDITGWLAGLGIAGLAVSLAAQDSVKNLFGSLTVFFDKPFVVGDFISYGGYTGTVEEIGFRSTRIRLLSGAVVTVPNMKWIDSNVENIQRRPYIRREMNVTITYDTPPDRIEQAVQIVRDVLSDPEVVESGRFDMKEQPPRVAFDNLNADSLNIKAFYWYQLADDPDRGWFTWFDHTQLVNMKLFRRFEEAGIEFAFPTQTLYLASDPQRQLAVRMLEADGETRPMP